MTCRCMPSADITVYRDSTTVEGLQVSLYLEQKGVQWEDLDVRNDPHAREQLKALTGQIDRPLVIVDGKLFIGYDPAVLDPVVPSRF